MKNDVSVKIEQTSSIILSEGHIPLLFCGMADSNIPYTVCHGMKDVSALVTSDSRLLQWANMLFLQDNAPEKIAIRCSLTNAVTSLDQDLNESWRHLIVCSESAEESTLAEIAQVLQSHDDKVLFASVPSIDEAALVPASDRIFLVLDPDMQGAAAAVVGATADLSMGSFSYKNIRLNEIYPQNLSLEEQNRAHEAGCVVLLEKAGDVVTSEGLTNSGEYLDVIDARDYIINEIVVRTQKLLNQASKIPYDNRGIAQLEAVCLGVLSEAYDNGLIAQNDDLLPDYTVYYAPRSQTKAEDRAQRRYVEGKFTFALAGAVHSVEITGTLII